MKTIQIQIDGYSDFIYRGEINWKIINEMFENWCSELGIGDGSLRIFSTVEKLKSETSPDIYVVNEDGYIFGEGFIK